MEDIKVCGKYCGECVFAQYGSGNKEEYRTWCEYLATSVLNTNDPLDQCPSQVIDQEK